VNKLNHFYTLLLGLLLIGCNSVPPTIQSEFNTGINDSINRIAEDTIYEKGVICAVEDWKGAFEIPLYQTSECIEVIDSIYVISHHDKDPEFMLKDADKQLILPSRLDYFHYFDEDSRKSALIFENEQNKALQVLTQTDGYWIKIVDLPKEFERFAWGTFLDSIPSYENVSINTVNRWIKLSNDTAYTKIISEVDAGRQQYAKIIEHDGIHFKLQAQIVDKWVFENGGNFNYLPIIKDMDDAGWAKAFNYGNPQVLFTRSPNNKSNYRLGIGLIKGMFFGSTNDGIRDSLFLSDKPNGKRIGWMQKSGLVAHAEGARLYNDINQERESLQGYDLSYGVGVWPYLRVYDKEDNWVHILGNQFEDEETWINLDDLDDSLYTYYSWVDYYKHFPEGNHWTGGYGYKWCGNKGALYTKPNTPREIILNFPIDCVIYLLGPTKGNMAKVKVQEVNFEIRPDINGYSGKDNVYREWVGWIDLVNGNGYANLDEIMIGC
jgi:hypothetical protein